jgi:diguanylate cyclase (GGDEF)-like protein
LNGAPIAWKNCPTCLTLVDGGIRRTTGEVFWRADGTPVPVDFTSAPSTDGQRSTGVVVVFSDVSDRRELEAQLRHLAEVDPLTELCNRRAFEHQLEERLVDRRCPSGALLLLDLDHFKFVNDSFGHAAGDDLIRAVADVLRERSRDGDVIARLGGDEFAVLLPTADAEAAHVVATRLLVGLEAARPSGLPISASIGAACFVAGAQTTAGDLMVAADIALYEAKDAGRGRVAFSSGQPGASLTWVERIRAALRDDRLVAYSQPIVDVQTGEVVQEELLVRMVDDGGRLVPPSSFLPTAESFGLIGEIDRLMVAKGIELAAKGRRVHVNLSGRSVGNDALLDEIETELSRTGADPANLVFELTETLAVANMADAGAFAGRLRQLGCELALDDFGTGFGSFTYLKHLPADYLKIDMEFVRDLRHNRKDRRVVDAIVGIAERFGQITIAEGVEDEETLVVLREAGVSLAQGFHLGRPAPADG